MKKPKSLYHGHRLPAVIINGAVRWYFRFSLSLRDSVKAAARVNNRAQNSHQQTRRRERQMCGFRDARRAQTFLSCSGQSGNTSRCPDIKCLRHFIVPYSKSASPVDMVGLLLTQCVRRTDEGTINPGVIWLNRYGQFGIEAPIPVYSRTGTHTGILVQAHLFFDDIFAGSIGKPLF
jgi:hypothetical protein